MEGWNKVEVGDFGGSIVTCILGNPLGLLARQLSYTVHMSIEQFPLYRVDKKPIQEYLEKKVEASYNEILDKASMVRQELSPIICSGEALEIFQNDYCCDE